MDAPATGINLSGSFERWRLDPYQEIEEASIVFTGLNVQQIRQILAHIPSAFKATMKITYTEQEE